MTNNEFAGSKEVPEKITDGTDKKGETRFEDLSAEQIAQYESFMEANPEPPAPEYRRDSGPEILEFEAAVASSESKYPIQELLLIATPAEALNHPGRKALKEELIPILAKLKSLEIETDISAEKLAELKLKYKKLSNAVGIIHGDEVDHNR
jgi:hypothetical protein